MFFGVFSSFSIFSSYLVARYLTVLRSLAVANFDCCNLSSNISPGNLLDLLGVYI